MLIAFFTLLIARDTYNALTSVDCDSLAICHDECAAISEAAIHTSDCVSKSTPHPFSHVQ